MMIGLQELERLYWVLELMIAAITSNPKEKKKSELFAESKC